MKEKIISMYKGGSKIILPNASDEDIICYVENDEDRVYCVIHNHEHEKDYHFVCKDNATSLILGAYAYPYMELIKGEDLGLDKFDVHDYEVEYAERLLRFVERNKDRNLEIKTWYHIYLGYCALKNDRGKKFTKAQIDKAQEIHDKGISKTLVKNIFDYLTNLVNN